MADTLLKPTGARTGAQFLEGLSAGDREIWLRGERVNGVEPQARALKLGVGGGDEPLGGGLEIAHAADDRVADGLVVEHGVQAVRAEQIDVAQLHFRIDLEHRVERQLALGRAFLLGDLGLARHAQVGLVGGLVESRARSCDRGPARRAARPPPRCTPP